MIVVANNRVEAPVEAITGEVFINTRQEGSSFDTSLIGDRRQITRPRRIQIEKGVNTPIRSRRFLGFWDPGSATPSEVLPVYQE